MAWRCRWAMSKIEEEAEDGVGVGGGCSAGGREGGGGAGASQKKGVHFLQTAPTNCAGLGRFLFF
jgi:hypothetical protein